MESSPGGYLSKWANYIKGWKRRWFELESPGVLVYYKGRPTSKKRGRKRYRGTIVLANARVVPHPTNKRRFTIVTPKGTFYFRAKNQQLRGTWITAIADAKAFYEQQVPTFQKGAQLSLDQSPRSLSPAPSSPSSAARRGTVDVSANLGELIGLADQVANAETRADALVSQVRLLAASHGGSSSLGGSSSHGGSSSLGGSSAIGGSSASMVGSPESLEGLTVAAEELVAAVHRCLEGMGEELGRRLRLEETVRDLTRANAALRAAVDGADEPPEGDNPSDDGDTADEDEGFGAARRGCAADAARADGRKNSASSSDDDDGYSSSGSFVDAMESLHVSRSSDAWATPPPGAAHGLGLGHGDGGAGAPPHSGPSLEVGDYRGPKHPMLAAVRENNTGENFQAMPSHEVVAWRDRLPCDKPGKKESGGGLWSLLKNAIGKDLSRITLPAYYNEPLTVLQRAAEELEHINLVREAERCDRSLERMMWVAAFAMSAYHTTVDRPGKPFNPMLGETFEWDRTKDPLGVRFFAEQVSHHPPISALHCVGREFVFHADSQIKSKFWGNSLEIIPTGTLHLHLPRHGEHYTWAKVTTCIHSLFGARWVDHYGDMTITNHKTGDIGHLKFIKKGWLSAQFEVTGSVSDARGTTFCLLWGHWNDSLWVLPPHLDEAERKRRAKVQAKESKAESKRGDGGSSKTKSGVFDPSRDPECRLLWRAPPRPAHSPAQYHLCSHAMALNDLPEELKDWIAPTDARLRPDQRCLEEGRAQDATQEKLRLEEKQRAARRRREAAGEPWKVQWFEKKYDPDSQTDSWVYTGDYWERRAKKDWEGLPDIW